MKVKMKKILFILDSLNYGGVETSFVNLANLLIDHYDIRVEILANVSPITSRLLDERVEIESSSNLIRYHFALLNNSLLLSPFYKIFYRLLKRIGIEQKYFSLLYRSNNLENFDLVISYSGYNGFTNYAALMKNAKQKISWIHNDPGSLGLDKIDLMKAYNDFDKIIMVSLDNYKSLVDINPLIMPKLVVLYNVLDADLIVRKSENENVSLQKNKSLGHLYIITVSRIQEKQKKISRIVETSRSLIERGFKDFEWNILGDGPDYSYIKKMILSNSLSDYVFLLGKVSNPYPYLANSNLFILTSDFEGLPVTLMEARILNLYIITTCFGSVNEIVTNKSIGVVVDKNPSSIADAIIDYYNSRDDLIVEDASDFIENIRKNVLKFFDDLFN